MTFFALSDLHITDERDPLYASLIRLLRERARSGDTIVLGGDVFDLFVGNKAVFTSRYAEFLNALGEADQRGVKLHYIEGNHDFLIKKAFRSVQGLRIHSKQVELDLDGRRFHVTHGDLIDKSDYGYRALRLFFRSPVMKALVALWPGGFLDWFGKKSSGASRGKKPLLPSELPIDRRERLRQAYRNYAAQRIAQGCDFVVAGHCHDLDEMSFIVDGRRGQYVNVGYPRVHGSMLTWSAGDERIQREPLP